MGVPAGALIPLSLVNASGEMKAYARRWEEPIKRLARLQSISFADAVRPGSAQIFVRGGIAALPLLGLVDLAEGGAGLGRAAQALVTQPEQVAPQQQEAAVSPLESESVKMISSRSPTGSLLSDEDARFLSMLLLFLCQMKAGRLTGR